MKSVGAVGVPLPTQAHDGEAITEQPRVAGIGGKIDIPAIDERENAGMSAVGNLKKKRTVGFLRVLGTGGDKVGREFHFAVFQVRGVGKVDDQMCIRDRLPRGRSPRPTNTGSTPT